MMEDIQAAGDGSVIPNVDIRPQLRGNAYAPDMEQVCKKLLPIRRQGRGHGAK
jgi:hypothetical protein